MTAQASQQPVIDFLNDPATHSGAPVKRIDTHAASVFLAGERALKIKRAVRFPFLDYSTLAKRKAACEAEIEVNRPLAPELYRGVVAITRERDGRLKIGGDGEPLEWAVDMVRFDENRTLDRITDKIDDDLADALVFLIERYSDESHVNIGWGEDISIAELAALIAEVVGFNGRLAYVTEKPDGMPRKLLDVSMLDRMGWRPKIGFREGLADAYRWFVANGADRAIA